MQSQSNLPVWRILTSPVRPATVALVHGAAIRIFDLETKTHVTPLDLTVTLPRDHPEHQLLQEVLATATKSKSPTAAAAVLAEATSETFRIATATFAPDGRHIVAVTDAKQVVVIGQTDANAGPTASWALLSIRRVSKRCNAVVVDPVTLNVLVGDRFGDVNMLPLLGKSSEPVESMQQMVDAVRAERKLFVEKHLALQQQQQQQQSQQSQQLQQQQQQQQQPKRDKSEKKQQAGDDDADEDRAHNDGTVLMGHLSMILDLQLNQKSNRLFTADKDEKVRVSHFPNAYNIESFCLGHTRSVSAIALLPSPSSGAAELLVSGSLDGTVRLWNPEQARCLQILPLADPVMSSSMDTSATSTTAVSEPTFRVAHFARNVAAGHIAVSAMHLPVVHIIALQPDATLQHVQTIQTVANVAHLAFDTLGRLWISQESTEQPTTVYVSDGGSYISIGEEGQVWLAEVNKNALFTSSTHRVDVLDELGRQFLHDTRGMDSYQANKQRREQERQERQDAHKQRVAELSARNLADPRPPAGDATSHSDKRARLDDA
ncbi:hypothetical protein CAOG_05735 [Capsaspora owczarzaki ATCC 30864]|uniref:tRNA (guanine-N(7)-)-methyltransferase non-catalytic subunit n=1 Tax=Capsaspora owczarzaki (strain ATCC 30864) TaxID=595528 RepID=A0A0D2WSP1_CAPO3|nr:hypothetical protein CAOG_05735 [Capsaspora owczarzaki ATCC 30864]KJE95265.1 hypothetical protein CAOG_005735 [Capsaspora owczarzaki ATCC 30864]|eukprot:XP_004346408.1 hypothetical protein CAOG_05735 [Capsaspora owczarzaki ATCC 30864]